jgi:DNA polymerase
MGKRNGFITLTTEIRNTLEVMAGLGCMGFECSEQSLKTIASWGKTKNFKPVRSVISPRYPAETLENILTDIGECQRCKLCKSRKNIVFGQGDPAARLVFVGEGPGAEEDQVGEPFVGEAGQLLTKIISAMKLRRDQVYICNVVKCRPPGNRNPEEDEIRACMPFLKRQIAAIRPEFICALGAVAAQAILKTDTTISKLRGRFHNYKGIKVMPTFHPAYLLRNPDKKREVWEDVQKIMKEYGV